MKNKDAYIAFCESRQDLPLFLQPWWLDAVTRPDGKEWEVLLARNKQGEIEAVMPFLVGKKWGMRYAMTPQLTQYTGVWIADKEGESATERLSREKRLQNEIIEQLEAMQFAFFDVAFPLSYTWWTPFFWAGYRQETRYTYRVADLSDTDAVFERLDYSKQKQIRKAQDAGITIDFEMTADALYDLQCLQLSDRGSTDVLSHALVRSTVENSRSRQQGLIVRARDGEGNTHAAILVVWDKTCAWELVSAIHPDFRNSGASTLVVWEAMRKLSGVVKVWDFEGSMIENVENSFRLFGATPVPYFRLRKQNKAAAIWEACKR